MKKYLSLLLLALLSGACNENKPSGSGEIPVTPEKPAKFIPTITYQLVRDLPHDSLAFTEGLLVHKGKMFESTGAPEEFPFTRSTFGIINQKTGKIDVKAELDRTIYFGEGIVILNNKIYQVTYKNKKGFVYDLSTFKKIKEFSYSNAEGWGMTTDGKALIMSDGSATLTYFDPEQLTPIRTLTVTMNGIAIQQLNELEYIKGYIYANVWMTNMLIKIDPATGEVVGQLNLSALDTDARHRYSQAMEMNGIAYDEEADKIYVSGKFWPRIYEIKFDH